MQIGAFMHGLLCICFCGLEICEKIFPILKVFPPFVMLFFFFVYYFIARNV